MKLDLQKRLASNIFGVGKKKVKFNLEKLGEIKEAITKSDIRKLISDKAIEKNKKNYHSKGSSRLLLKQKRKNRRKGRGSKKGKVTSRLPRKEKWINKIRAQRKLLNELKDKNNISTTNYRKLRNKCKGGFFRSRRHLNLFISENNLLKNKDGK